MYREMSVRLLAVLRDITGKISREPDTSLLLVREDSSGSDGLEQRSEASHPPSHVHRPVSLERGETVIICPY